MDEYEDEYDDLGALYDIGKKKKKGGAPVPGAPAAPHERPLFHHGFLVFLGSIPLVAGALIGLGSVMEKREKASAWK